MTLRCSTCAFSASALGRFPKSSLRAGEQLATKMGLSADLHTFPTHRPLRRKAAQYRLHHASTHRLGVSWFRTRHCLGRRAYTSTLHGTSCGTRRSASHFGPLVFICLSVLRPVLECHLSNIKRITRTSTMGQGFYGSARFGILAQVLPVRTGVPRPRLVPGRVGLRRSWKHNVQFIAVWRRRNRRSPVASSDYAASFTS